MRLIFLNRVTILFVSAIIFFCYFIIPIFLNDYYYISYTRNR